MTSPGRPLTRADAAPTAGPLRASIVAFDFDGTLTERDSFIGFLRWRTSRWRWALGLLWLVPDVLVYLATRDRRRLKAASVRIFLRGLSREALAVQAERFAAARAAEMFRPDALLCWNAHKAAGDRVVIVTASPQEVVAPFAARLGAHALIGSRLAWTPQGRVGGGLDGPNCRGVQKVARLQGLLGPGLEVTDAYGDTSGDREMLAFARRGHMKRFVGRPPACPDQSSLDPQQA